MRGPGFRDRHQIGARAALLLAAACAPTPAVDGPDGRERFPPFTPPGLEEFIAVPDSNPLSPEKAALGRRLFFDPVLSRDSSVACASCHRPELGFADSVRLSPGLDGRTGHRNTPTLLNRAYGRAFFWDGRSRSLEETVLRPITNANEMDLALEDAVARLRSDPSYVAAFVRAFDGPPDTSMLSFALASYVRTLRSGGSPADRHALGDDGALSPAAIRGRAIFAGRGNCAVCHIGPVFTDEGFHNTGVGWGGGDAGRYDHTGNAEDRGRFKTPTLRDVATTAPYMHDGSLRTLRDVVEFYDRGGGPNPYLDPEIRPLDLSAAEQRDLVKFLRALTGRRSP